MTYDRAVEACHVRSAIHRRAKPDVKYWKNRLTSLDKRVPAHEKRFDDWEEYDPHENDCTYVTPSKPSRGWDWAKQAQDKVRGK